MTLMTVRLILNRMTVSRKTTRSMIVTVPAQSCRLQLAISMMLMNVILDQTKALEENEGDLRAALKTIEEE